MPPVHNGRSKMSVAYWGVEPDFDASWVHAAEELLIMNVQELKQVGLTALSKAAAGFAAAVGFQTRFERRRQRRRAADAGLAAPDRAPVERRNQGDRRANDDPEFA
jgi:hypothetical protein